MHAFHAGSAIHVAVLLGVAAACIGLARSGQLAAVRGPTDGRRFDHRFANVILGVWIVIFLRDLRPDRLAWINSLPLHICDIVGFAAVLAIRYRLHWARAMLYFWGLSLCSQAFCFPVLRAGPIHFDFWLYWLQHGIIVAAAVYDLVVRGYRSSWRDWRRMSIALAIYAVAIVPLNVKLQANYGYLGLVDQAQRSTVAAMGPWPDRLPVMYLAACALMAAMALPWRWKRRGEPAPHAVRAQPADYLWLDAPAYLRSVP